MKIRNDNRGAGAIEIDPPGQRRRPQVFTVSDAQEVRDFILWLLCSGGYRVVSADSDLVADTLLLTEYPVLVVAEADIPFCENWELLAFSHAQYPEAPVLVASKNALGRRPEICRWISESLSMAS